LSLSQFRTRTVDPYRERTAQATDQGFPHAKQM
jgi:hypothetical protein